MHRDRQFVILTQQTTRRHLEEHLYVKRGQRHFLIPLHSVRKEEEKHHQPIATEKEKKLIKFTPQEYRISLQQLPYFKHKERIKMKKKLPPVKRCQSKISKVCTQETQTINFVSNDEIKYASQIKNLEKKRINHQKQLFINQKKQKYLKSCTQAQIFNKVKLFKTTKMPKEQQFTNFLEKYFSITTTVTKNQFINKNSIKIIVNQKEVYFGETLKQQSHGIGLFMSPISLFQGVFLNGKKVFGTQFLQQNNPTPQYFTITT